MPEETQGFASMIYRNNVAPEQVLFDAGCTDYADERAHIAIAQAAENLMREGYESTAESTDDDDDARSRETRVICFVFLGLHEYQCLQLHIFDSSEDLQLYIYQDLLCRTHIFFSLFIQHYSLIRYEKSWIVAA